MHCHCRNAIERHSLENAPAQNSPQSMIVAAADLFMRGPRSLCLSLDILVCGGAQAPVGCDGVRLAASMKSGGKHHGLTKAACIMEDLSGAMGSSSDT